MLTVDRSYLTALAVSYTTGGASAVAVGIEPSAEAIAETAQTAAIPSLVLV
ncbi:hypothetical protein RFN29_34355 [Mesorhizobium sp. VK22B]|uniref:Uncharacterized protein n=1 Tax=Mesorhizobium captivum TaxID=3072319 RepID=A0ABU4ZBC2_9HYPH|nr:hypothetical protein [Mesorhizobium sp. VK22B]MDX8496592.1 hypothetical protein [Mesorhizobium sp. VK22B]